MLEVGIPYIVTKGSDDGTFEVGDHVKLLADGNIVCREAAGWIDAEDVQVATEGMLAEIDSVRLAALKNKLLEELQCLESYMQR